MIIQSLRLKNFRCFDETTFEFDKRCVIIQGHNGIGKTSLLEALHYSCYLKSFRTHLNQELVKLDQKHFYLEIEAQSSMHATSDRIKAGFSQESGKQVLLNGRQIASYKELIDQHKIVTLCAQDSDLVNGAPEYRRDFLNYSLLLIKPSLITLFQHYKKALAQRNALMLRGQQGSRDRYFNDEVMLWSQKLWEYSLCIQQERINYLRSIEERITLLLKTFFRDYQEDKKSVPVLPERLKLVYQPKGIGEHKSFETFWADWTVKNRRLDQEFRYGRSLFGAHLDDFALLFEQKKARIFASRGQQKLLTFLLKLAQIQETNSTGEPGILLLDDFITDFDAERITECLALITSLNFQVFLTCPTNSPVLDYLPAQRLMLT